jgi:anti-anti-sigma factor
MEIKDLNPNQEYTHIAMSGSLDIAGVQGIELEFSKLSASGKSVVIDMSDVSFVASLGMRMLLSAAKKLNAEGLKVVLLSPQPLVKAALETAGLETVLPIVEDLDSAVKTLGI